MDLERAAHQRGVTVHELLDRNVNELLQELRVAQTGVQVLFAFLLTLAFTDRFDELETFGTTVYVFTLLTVALAVISFAAPVAFHRLVFRRGQKQAFVDFGGRAVLIGMALLQAGITSALLLVLDVVLGRWPAVLAAGVIGAVGLVAWWVFPLRHRARCD